CPRAPKSSETGGHYDQRLASDRKGFGVGARSGRGIFIPADAQQGAEKCRTGNDSASAKEECRQNHFRSCRSRDQPANSLRTNGKTWHYQRASKRKQQLTSKSATKCKQRKSQRSHSGS